MNSTCVLAQFLQVRGHQQTALPRQVFIHSEKLGTNGQASNQQCHQTGKNEGWMELFTKDAIEIVHPPRRSRHRVGEDPEGHINLGRGQRNGLTSTTYLRSGDCDKTGSKCPMQCDQCPTSSKKTRSFSSCSETWRRSESETL